VHNICVTLWPNAFVVICSTMVFPALDWGLMAGGKDGRVGYARICGGNELTQDGCHEGKNKNNGTEGLHRGSRVGDAVLLRVSGVGGRARARSGNKRR
jgi:hypothetical protein